MRLNQAEVTSPAEESSDTLLSLVRSTGLQLQATQNDATRARGGGAPPGVTLTTCL